MNKFRVYPSQVIHYGRHAPEAAHVVRDWMYKSLCGRELIGCELTSEPEEWEVCARCKAVFAKDQATYRELVEKYS